MSGTAVIEAGSRRLRNLHGSRCIPSPPKGGAVLGATLFSASAPHRKALPKKRGTPVRHPLHIDQEHNDAIRAEVGERLGIILSLQSRQKLPGHIRHLIDRLAEQDHQIELQTSPSIVPSRDEGWLCRLLVGRFR
jgi:hypothetical protein